MAAFQAVDRKVNLLRLEMTSKKLPSTAPMMRAVNNATISVAPASFLAHLVFIRASVVAEGDLQRLCVIALQDCSRGLAGATPGHLHNSRVRHEGRIVTVKRVGNRRMLIDREL